jgi:DNA-binding MarR family transcriptional regulator
MVMNGRAPRAARIADIVQGLRRIVKALHLYSQEVRGAYGLTGPQLWALKTLHRSGRLSVGALANALAVHQSSISLVLRRLEQRGLIRRIRGAGDRRVVHVELTRRGAATVAGTPEPAQGRLLHALDRMPAAQLETLRQAVDQLVAAMEVRDVKARFFFSDS